MAGEDKGCTGSASVVAGTKRVTGWLGVPPAYGR